MNYYERHLGDYARDTSHLSMLEHGAYTLLMDRYYHTETGIPADQAHRLARARSREEKAAVDAVLSEFFLLVDGVWIKGRIQAEIEKFSKRIDVARKNGLNGGRPKKEEKTFVNQQNGKPSGLILGSENITQTKALHTPDTNIEAEKDQKTSASRPCDGPKAERFAEFWTAYPEKVGKPKCLAKWKADGLDAKADQILANIAQRKLHDRRWLGGFIPNPATFLNQERWADPVETGPPRKPPIAQQFHTKTYTGTPENELPSFLRTGTD